MFFHATPRRLAVFAVAILAMLGVCIGGAAGADSKKSSSSSKSSKSSKPAAKSAKSSSKSGKSAAPDVIPRDVPWTLRCMYGFPVGRCAFQMDEQTSDMRIVLDDTTELLRSAGFSIALADGKTLTSVDFERAVAERKPFEDCRGTGTNFTLRFPVKEGVLVELELASYSNRSFKLLTLKVTNAGTEKIGIAKLCPMTLSGVGGVMNWSTETQMTLREYSERAGCPVIGGKGTCDFALWLDKKTGQHLVLGVLQRGRGAASVAFEPYSGGWQGEVKTVFSPSETLLPGAQMCSAPVFLSYGDTSVAQANRLHSWCATLEARPDDAALDKARIRAWVTVPEDGALGDLEDAARDAASWGVKYALIPGHWEGRPGAMKGASPRYPKDMGNAAKSLAGAGVVAGITFEPLAVEEGQGTWSGKSADGQTWLNIAEQGAKDCLAERVKEIVKWGYGFIIVPPSAVPDEVLAGFGMSRGDADDQAFRAVSAAAASLPVLPASALTLKAERDAWLRVSAAAAHISIFDGDPAPVRLDAAGLGALDVETMAAMRLWSGPFEIVGKPDMKGKTALGEMLSKPVLAAYPLEPASSSPLLWEYEKLDDAGVVTCGAVLSFRGVAPWKQPALVLPGTGENIVWRCPDGAFVDVVNQAVGAPESLGVYGVLPKPDRPVVMGLSTGLVAGLDQITKVAWDAEKMVLSGQIKGPVEEKTQAFVLAPEGWEFKKGEVGKEKVKGEMLGRRLAFDVPPAGSAFSVEFKQGK